MKTRDYVKVRWEYLSVEINIEVKDSKIDGNILDETLNLKLVQDAVKPYFEGLFEGQKLILYVPTNREYIAKASDFVLPSSIANQSKDRIAEGINEFLNVMYN